LAILCPNRISSENSYNSNKSLPDAEFLTTTYTSTDVGETIDGSPSPHTSVIVVPTNECVTDINIVNLNVNHSWVNDMIIRLRSPEGTIVNLMVNTCWSQNNVRIGFDDQSASAPNTWPCPPTDNQSYQPVGLLAAFNGQNSGGTWTLEIIDTYPFADNGTLNGWQLQVTTEACPQSEICGNGIDDDGDGAIDCEDNACDCNILCITAEICDDEIDNDCDGLIDGFDGDCPCDNTNLLELCEPECEYTPPVIPNFDIEEEWASTDSVNTLVPFVVGEMDGNRDASEVLALRDIGTTFSEPNMFYIFDGANGDTKFHPNTLPISSFSKGFAIGDTDRDGLTEFFYIVSGVDVNFRRLVSYEYNPAGVNSNGTGTGTFDLQWTSDQRVTAGLPTNRQWFAEDFSTALADFNQDGVPEVYIANEIFNAVTGQRIATGGSNSIGSFLYDIFSGHSHPHSYPVAVDVLPNGDCGDCAGLELVAGNQVYSVNIATGTMTVVNEAPNGLPDGMTSIADYDLDGDLDAIITYTTSAGSYLYVWDLQTETQIGNTHTVTTAAPSGAFRRSVSNVTISDFDGDNRPELGVCGNGVFQVVDDYTININGTGGVVWSIITSDRSGLTGATSFDFNGDGINEVVYRDETNLRIISGPSGVNLATFPCGSVTGSEYPIVVDIDNDNESEIACSCGDITYSRGGPMKTFHARDFPWVPTRNIWNQYPYFIVNINNNMTIPIQQQQHQLVGNPPPGLTGRLNIFLKQVGPFDNDGEPIFPAANIQTEAIDLERDDCSNDLSDITINIELTNDGDLTFPPRTPVAVYIGDPETTAAILVDTFQIDQAIIPAGSILQTFSMDFSGFTPPFTIYIVGNDDGSITPPFNLDNDFPSTSVGECEFENNKDSLLFSACEDTPPTFTNVPVVPPVSCTDSPPELEPTATDNCPSPVTLTFRDNEIAGDCDSEKLINRTWIATDDCGNSATAVQVISIVDDNDPVISGVPDDISVDCENIPGPAAVTATDDCSSDITITQVSIPDPGVDTDNYTGAPNAGITTPASSYTFDLTGYDNLDATYFQDITINFQTRFGKGRAEFLLIAPNGEAIVLVGDHCTTGECADGDVGLETYSPTFYDCANNHPVWNNDEFIPEGDGNFTPHGGTTTGHPGATSFVNCFSDFTGELNGTWTISALRGGSGGFTFLDYSVNINTACTNPKSFTRYYVATDDCGNSSSAGQHITLVDTTNPTFDKQPASIGDILCTDEFPTQEILTASDNCGSANVVPQVDPFTVDRCAAYEVTYRWTATDNCGNSTEVTRTFNVLPDRNGSELMGVPNDTTVNCNSVVDTSNVRVLSSCGLDLMIDFEEKSTEIGCSYTITRTWSVEISCNLVDETFEVSTPSGSRAQDFYISNFYQNNGSPPNLTSMRSPDYVTGGDVAPGNNWFAPISGSSFLALQSNSNNAVFSTNSSTQNDGIFIEYSAAELASRGLIVGDSVDLSFDYAPGYNYDVGSRDSDLDSELKIWFGSTGSGFNLPTPNTSNILVTTPPNQTIIPGAWSPIGDDSGTDIMDINSWLEFQTNFEYLGGAIQVAILSGTGPIDSGFETIYMDNINLNIVPVVLRDSQIIEVIDTQAPVFDRTPITISSINCEDALPTQETLTATDECGTATVTPSVDPYTENQCGGYTITYRWTAEDECGNTSETTQTFNVLGDSAGPTFDSPPSTIGNINCGDALPTQETLTASDACGTATVTPSVDTYTEDNCNGYTVTYRWVATDECNNTTEVTQSFDVLEDNTDPVFVTQPAAISNISCDDALPIQETLTASDGCGSVTVVPSVDTYTEDNCGGYTITYRWVATDACNNTAEVTQSFDVLADNVGPVFDVQPGSIGDITCEDALPTQQTLTATDACGTASVAMRVDPFTEDQCGLSLDSVR